TDQGARWGKIVLDSSPFREGNERLGSGPAGPVGSNRTDWLLTVRCPMGVCRSCSMQSRNRSTPTANGWSAGFGFLVMAPRLPAPWPWRSRSSAHRWSLRSFQTAWNTSIPFASQYWLALFDHRPPILLSAPETSWAYRTAAQAGTHHRF